MACSGDVIAVGDDRGWLYRYSVMDPFPLISKIKAHDGVVEWLCSVDILEYDVFVCSGRHAHKICVCDMRSKSTKKIEFPRLVYGVHTPLRDSHVFSLHLVISM